MKKYEKVREKRSLAGKKSAEIKKQKAKKEQISTKSTSVKSVEQASTKSTVNVNDNVNVNVNVKEDKPSFVLLSSLNFQSEELKACEFNRMAFSFWNLFKSNSQEAGIKKTTVLDKAKLQDYSSVFRLMVEKDSRTLEEIQAVFKFLKVSEFWKPNIRSAKKLRDQ